MSDSQFYNKTIPELINKSKLFTDKIKKRIKIRELLNKFDIRASKDFKNYINESSKRYQEIKSGCDLNSMLSSSKERYIKNAKLILSDDYYNKFNTDEEKVIMKMRPDLKKLNEIKEISNIIRNRKDSMKLNKFDSIEPKINHSQSSSNTKNLNSMNTKTYNFNSEETRQDKIKGGIKYSIYN